MRRLGAQSVLFVVILAGLIVNSGCNLIGVIGTPGSFEQKIPPQYNLQAQQDRKLLLWIECPRSSNVDYDVEAKLRTAFQIYLIERARIKAENIFTMTPSTSPDALYQDPVKIAQSMGVGYVLVVQVSDFELFRMNVRDYYAGQMESHAVLMDADLGMAVWPLQAAAKVTEVGVDMETKGRAAALGRLVSATAHCTLRYLYPCEKLKFKAPEEKISIQDAYDMETF